MSASVTRRVVVQLEAGSVSCLDSFTIPRIESTYTQRLLLF